MNKIIVVSLRFLLLVVMDNMIAHSHEEINMQDLTSHVAEPRPIVLIADQRVLRIPIIEGNEQLIDLRDQNEIRYGTSPEIPDNQDYTKMRFTIYDKLKAAQALLPQALFLCVYEGYRSLMTQKKIFEERYKKLQDLHPEWKHEHLFEETTKLVSPVVNKDGSINIQPHSTGGAIDVYLVDKNGHIVDMGICIKDWLSDVSGELSAANSDKISEQAKIYRKIMSDVLEAVGFVNYPTEYWHWSFGDRYWAYHAKAGHALYNSL